MRPHWHPRKSSGSNFLSFDGFSEVTDLTEKEEIAFWKVKEPLFSLGAAMDRCV